MKQWKKLLAAFLACAMLAGCSAGQKQEAASPEMGELAQAGQETGDSRNRITGKITEITGNEVTLALGTFSRNGKAQTDTASGGADPAARAEEAGGSPEKTQAAAARGGAISLENASVSGRQDGGAPPEEQGAPPEENVSSGTFEANGETLTIYIPVGLTISGASSGQRSSGFSSLKKGMVLRLAMGTDGSGDSVVTAVTVLKK